MYRLCTAGKDHAKKRISRPTEAASVQKTAYPAYRLTQGYIRDHHIANPGYRKFFLFHVYNACQ
jgi:hypothetical protein